jgi:hypothetical protein
VPPAEVPRDILAREHRLGDLIEEHGCGIYHAPRTTPVEVKGVGADDSGSRVGWTRAFIVRPRAARHR